MSLVRRLFVFTTAGLLVGLLVLGLAVAPPDRVQGDAQRLMYLHVPTAWVAYLAFGVTAIASVLFLIPKTRSPRWDRIGAASAEAGVIFTALTILLGALWGRPVWGVWWTWDARLVTTVVLLFLYLGYLALRRIPSDPDVRARRSAVAALIAFADVPIVHFSVVWWRTLHQQPTVLNPELNPQIEGILAATLLLGVVAFTALFVLIVSLRYRLAAMEEASSAESLWNQVADRRRTAGLDPLTEVAR